MRSRFRSFLAATAAVLVVMGSTAHGAVFVYNFIMDAPSENPSIPATLPGGSLGTGTGTATYDDVAGTLALSAQFSGLSGNVTVTHFHGLSNQSGLAAGPNPTPAQRQAAAAAASSVGIMIGNPSLPGFPTGATSGVYNPAQPLNLNDSAIYNTTFLNTTHGGNVANARAAFISGMNAGRVYWNIHSTVFGGGEIRGFSSLVPEPTSIGLAGVGLLALIRARRRR